MVSLFVGQLCIFLHVSLLFLVGLRVVNIPFGRLIECCTYDVNSSEVILRWHHKNDLEGSGFSAQTLSDGTARFICMATLFLQPKDLRPATIVLDEPEIGLHPTALAVLSEIIQAVANANDGSQVIISTQSVELANYFEPDDFIVVNYDNGKSEFKRLDKKVLGDWIDTYQVGGLE